MHITLKYSYKAELKMAKLRLLSVDQFKNDIKDSWVNMTDPVTKKKDLPHYDVRCFLDNFYKAFFQENNDIVKCAVEADIELGSDYDNFFKLGMRVSQQLDGVYREICMDDYEIAAYFLRKKLIDRAIEKVNRERPLQLEDLINEASSLPFEEIHEISETISNIMPKPATEPKTKEIRPEYRQLGHTGLVYKMNAILKDEFEQLKKYFPRVPDRLKIQFFRIATFCKIRNQEYDIVEHGLEDIFNIISQIETVHAEIYLTYVQHQLEYGDFYKKGIVKFEKYLDKLHYNMYDLFFSVLAKTQEEGMKHSEIEIAYQASRLIGMYNKKQRQNIINESFELFRKKDEYAAFDYLKEKTRGRTRRILADVK